MTPEEQPSAGRIPLASVQGEILYDALSPSRAIGAGLLKGGCLGVCVSLKGLQAAVDAAISRMYPFYDKDDDAASDLLVDLQIVTPDYNGSAGAPMLIIGGRDANADGFRQCVALAGVFVDRENERSPQDAIEAREAV